MSLLPPEVAAAVRDVLTHVTAFFRLARPPCDLQLIGTPPFKLAQHVHTDSDEASFNVAGISLHAGLSPRFPVYDRPFINPCISNWKDAVPRGDWNKMEFDQYPTCIGDIIAFSSQRLHAGPGNSTQNWRYVIFAAWPASLPAINCNTETVARFGL